MTLNDGLKINVDIDQLIEKIYIHPKSENWYKNLVIDLVKQLGFDFAIEKSDLESDILI
jgi:3-isopropylmalate dehydratase small subunit